MRNFSVISLIILLLSVGIFSCRKKDKSFVTNVELINPEVNTLIRLPDTIQVKFKVESEKDVEFVSISIVNSNYIPLFGTYYVDAPISGETIEKAIPLKALQNTNEAPYYILIAVNYKEDDKWNSYFEIQLANKPINYQGFYLFSRPFISQTAIDFYDQNLEKTSFIQTDGEYVDSDISSFYGKLFLLTHTPAKLKAYSVEEQQLVWEALPQFPHPEYTTIEMETNRVYAAMENGQIVGYSEINGQQQLITERLVDSFPEKISIIENYIIAAYQSRNNGNRTLVTFYKLTGHKKHRRSIDFEVVSFIKTEEPDRLFIFGNRDQNGIVSIFNAQDNSFEDTHQFDVGKIGAVCKVEDEDFIISVENKLYSYNWPQKNLALLMEFEDIPFKIEYEHLSGRIIVLFSNRLIVYQFPGMIVISNLEMENTLKGLQFFYQFE